MINFKIGKDGDKFHAFCPTPEEALKNLKNAVSIWPMKKLRGLLREKDRSL